MYLCNVLCDQCVLHIPLVSDVFVLQTDRVCLVYYVFVEMVLSSQLPFIQDS